MRVLFDVVHPAHVHFFKHMVRELESRGHEARLVAREKDVTTSLLDRLGFTYSSIGRAGGSSRFNLAAELVRRDIALVRAAKEFQADLIVTRSPAGAQVGRLLGIRSVFDTDDGRSAGIHFWAAAPFAHVVTTPDCMKESYGSRHVKYPGYKQTAYLHPNHYTPDPSVRSALGLRFDERYYIVRFVAMTASHDVGETGLSAEAKRILVATLQQRGRVFLSSEGPLPDDLASLRFPLPPDRLHDALAFADMLVGDSQTMAAEAAVLGTPSLRVSSWIGRLAYLQEIEERYALTIAFHPARVNELLAQLDAWLADPELKTNMRSNRDRLLSEKVDVAQWFVRFLEAGAPTPYVAVP